MQRVGVISDTHGLLRPEAIQALQGSHLIIHGGDIGNASILRQLESIAPVHAVRGNNDRDSWADSIPESLILEIEKLRFYVIHDLNEIERNVTSTCAVVISGHSHRPRIDKKDGVLYVNPGSAGPRRFKLPVTVGAITVIGKSVEAQIIPLEPR